MTAAQIAREFTKWRRLQCLLREYEEQHGQVCGVQHLRQHVIQQMKRLARMMRYGATAAGLLLLIVPALAHDSWISRQRIVDPVTGEWCCNLHDCQVEAVREVSGGYSTAGGDVVPFSRVIWKSPDGRWWRCRYLGGEKAGKTRCLIGPIPAM